MSLTVKNWVAIGAVSALSVGGMAGGAVASASTMQLVAGNTSTPVPGLTINDDGSVSPDQGDVTFDVNSESIASPSPASPDSPDSPDSVDSVDSPFSPASVSAASPASVDSPASPDSPDSPASIDSPASVDSPDSPPSVDSVD